ncbi:MAG: zinc transporter ZupT [Clostridia bacterium]
MDNANILPAFLLTLFAGLSTGIGGAIAFFTKKTNKNFLSVALGFSAGVMIYISFVEILPKAIESLSGEYSQRTGTWIGIIAFFAGILMTALIDKAIPTFENPHEVRTVEQVNEAVDETLKNSKLLRTGIFMALAVAFHNFPEGFATFMATMKDPALGIGIAVAVAIHNIPEGIAVSVPIYHATGSRKKAFLYSFLSGLAEPVGAIIGFLLLSQFMNDTMFGIVFALIGGIMVFISFDQLLPTAREYGRHHLSIMGLVGGMAVMAVSLVLFM